MSNLPQQTTINQYVADGITSIYNYTFLILSASSSANDISVYVTPSGQIANPLANIQVLNEDYTVQNVGNVNGGTITFLADAIPTNGAIVTIVRTMNVSIDTEFAQAQNFNGGNLDSAFERVVLILQQLNTYYQNNALSYVINSYLPSLGTNFLPVITNADNQIWISQGGKVIAGTLANDSMSTLRSQLASQTPGGDGTSIIGYYDTVNNVGQTLSNFLNTFPRPSNGNLIIGGDMSTNPFQRGSTFNAPAFNTFIADRFVWTGQGSATGKINSSKANDSPAVSDAKVFGVNSLKLAVSTNQLTIPATDSYTLQYRVEGYDFQFIAQRSFTLNFWVKTNLPGTYCVAFANSGGDQCYIAEYTVSVSNVWTQITIHVPASPSAGTWSYTTSVGLYISWCLGAGTNWQGQSNTWQVGNFSGSPSQINWMSSNTNIWQIDRVSLEPGNLVTPWVARSIAEELELCERYYQKSYNILDLPGAITLSGMNTTRLPTATGLDSFVTQPFRKRVRTAAPVITIYSPVTGASGKVADGTTSADVAVTAQDQSETTFRIMNASGGNISAFDYINWHWTADAEL